MQHASLVGWLENHHLNSNAYRVIDTYRLFIEGVEYVVEIFDNDVESPYRYTVRVTHMETGRSSELGNGGATPEEALDVFHWQDILVRADG